MTSPLCLKGQILVPPQQPKHLSQAEGQQGSDMFTSQA